MGNQNIPGGRAYYVGKNAYASQAFELDTRRLLSEQQALNVRLQNQITELQEATAPSEYLAAFLRADQAIAAGGSDVVLTNWTTGTYSLLPARHTGMNWVANTDGTFTCQKNHTAEVSASMRITQVLSTSTVSLNAAVRVQRGTSLLKVTAASYTTTNTTSTQMAIPRWVFAFQKGDILALVASQATVGYTVLAASGAGSGTEIGRTWLYTKEFK